MAVSILAQPGGRALLNKRVGGGIDIHGFNPRPARGPGAAVASSWSEITRRFFVSILAQPGGRALLHPLAHSASKLLVSILAQPGGRALPLIVGVVAHGLAVFQSSPSPGAGRCNGRSKIGLARAVFQSSPSPGAGRCNCYSDNSNPRDSCFNPRPARGPGAA